MTKKTTFQRISELRGDELAIVEKALGAILDRIEDGRSRYGVWHVDDGRDYAAEAREELLDGLMYLAAENVLRGRTEAPQPASAHGEPDEAAVLHEIAETHTGWPGQCAVPGCDCTVKGSRGLCNPHYKQWRRWQRADRTVEIG